MTYYIIKYLVKKDLVNTIFGLVNNCGIDSIYLDPDEEVIYVRNDCLEDLMWTDYFVELDWDIDAFERLEGKIKGNEIFNYYGNIKLGEIIGEVDTPPEHVIKKQPELYEEYKNKYERSYSNESRKKKKGLLKRLFG